MYIDFEGAFIEKCRDCGSMVNKKDSHACTPPEDFKQISQVVKQVRIDIWKPSGDWYTTDYIDWIELEDGVNPDDWEHPRDTLRRCVLGTYKGTGIKVNGLTITCLEPGTSKACFPLMITIEEKVDAS